MRHKCDVMLPARVLRLDSKETIYYYQKKLSQDIEKRDLPVSEHILFEFDSKYDPSGGFGSVTEDS